MECFNKGHTQGKNLGRWVSILGWGFGFPGDSSGKELACQC